MIANNEKSVNSSTHLPVYQKQTTKKDIQQFSNNLDCLQTEAKLFDDTLKILLSWDDMVARQLHSHYDHQMLLQLHGLEDASLVQQNYRYQIMLRDSVLLSFYICQHRIYTPIGENVDIHQCLLC